MTVKISYVIEIAKLTAWRENLAPVFTNNNNLKIYQFM